MAYGSETQARAARIDLALVGQVVIALSFFSIYGVPLYVTSWTLILYLLFIAQPSAREYVLAVALAYVNVFFREINTRGRHNIPQGPIVFVIAPHANQMLDPLVVIGTCGREKDIGFLAAAKTVRSKQFGWLARTLGSIPVERPQDLAEKRDGTITTSRARVIGQGTDFSAMRPKSSIMAKGEIIAVKEVVSATELVLAMPFKDDILEPSSWKEVPHVDQHQVYKAVYDHLAHGNAFGIFPEGGSHDRSDLLPLKAGAAIMALGAVAEHPDMELNIVPVGLNYFAGDRFRSRVYVDYGRPIAVTKELAAQYLQGGEAKRAAVSHIMDEIKAELDTLTLTADNHEILKIVWAARRLYMPTNMPADPKERLRLSHLFLEGYKQARDHPVIQELTHHIQEYNDALEEHGLHDHQVGRIPTSNARARRLLIERTWLLLVYCLVAIPGGILWLPIWLVSQRVSELKKKEALAGSIVKIEGKDVVGTWKVMTMAGMAPLLLCFYCVVIGLYFRSLNAVQVFLYTIVPSVYVSVRAYENIPRLWRSLRALRIVVRDNSDGQELTRMRANLKAMVRRIVDEDPTGFRAKVSPDFDLEKTRELRRRFSADHIVEKRN